MGQLRGLVRALAWDNDETIWIEDASDEDRPRCGWARAAGLTTAVAVPVEVDGRRHGLIEAYRRPPGPRDEDVIAVLETIATQLGGLERMLEAGNRWR
jgi:GAF domain-containing protein